MLVRDGAIDVDTPTGPMRTYVYEPFEAGRAEEPVPVMVPEVYHSRLAPGTVLGYDDAGKAKGNALKVEIEVATFDQDTDAVLRALAAHPRSNQRLGAIGFC